MATSTNAMNPPISGQYMGERYRRRGGRAASGVQCHLLVRRGESPGDLEPALLAEDEAKLPGRAQALGMVGTEGRAGIRLRQCTEEVLPKEAVFAAYFY
jgi:hypothetical protein